MGRKAGRTIYLQHGAEPGEFDRLIGMVDTPQLASFLVEAANEKLAAAGDAGRAQSQLRAAVRGAGA